MRKKRTLVIGIASFDDVIKDTIEACKKAKRGQPSGPVDMIEVNKVFLFASRVPV